MAFLKTGDAQQVDVLSPDDLITCPQCGLIYPSAVLGCPNCADGDDIINVDEAE